MEQTVLSFPGRLLLTSLFRQESYSKIIPLPHLKIEKKRDIVHVLSKTETYSDN